MQPKLVGEGDLEEKDASTDGRGDDGPAGHEEVAGVVANHVVHRYPEPPGKNEDKQEEGDVEQGGAPSSKSPGDCDALEEHEEEETHAAGSVLVKQLEHVDSALVTGEALLDVKNNFIV